MKKNYKMWIITVMLIGTLCLTGCAKYISSWSATMYVHSNTSHSAYMNFGTLNGTEVQTLKCKEETGTLKYSAKLEIGSATVYIDYDGEKKELFKIGAGEEIEDSFDGLKEGKVYIIVETDGKCEEGKCEFEIEE